MSAAAVAAARLKLHAAHRERAEALALLEAARAAADRARDFAVAVRDRCTAVEEETRDLAIDCSIAVRNAIVEGRTPMFEATPTLTANALAERELAHRAMAAEMAQADLESAAGEAMRAATAADEELRAAAQAVALAIAHEMAEEAEALESRALELRVRIGGAMGAVGQFPVLTNSMRNVVSQTDDYFSDRLLRDGRLWNARKHADEVWRPFIGALIENPEALLDFDQPEGRKAAA